MRWNTIKLRSSIRYNSRCSRISRPRILRGRMTILRRYVRLALRFHALDVKSRERIGCVATWTVVFERGAVRIKRPLGRQVFGTSGCISMFLVVCVVVVGIACMRILCIDVLSSSLSLTLSASLSRRKCESVVLWLSGWI